MDSYRDYADDVLDIELEPIRDEPVALAMGPELALQEASVTMSDEADDDESASDSAPSMMMQPDGSSTEQWLSAPEAAQALGVSPRRLRRMASIGKIARRRDAGHYVYLVSRTPTPSESTGASLAMPETHSGRHVRERAESLTAALDERSGGVSRKESSIHEDKTVIVSDDEIEYLDGELVPSELMQTNRELMKLVDSVLGRWSEVSNRRTDSASDIRRALERALDAQQCLHQWQHYASSLERQLLEKTYTASRALDVADEVLATTWTSRGRRQSLRDRLAQIRGSIEA